ncbi:MAG: DUF1156 domain-containing protein [Desulfovibrio sp.]|nr:DUF1156 domain-containing protein [Desulfovibrio sp.]
MAAIRKLIEVSLPMEAINMECAREKSIRHGHPSTLHIWWSRKPLAAARAFLWASLVDDPSSHPELFPTEEAQAAERARLHNLLAELVKWENNSNKDLLDQARAEIRKYMGEETLVFLDPFAGGGSLPLEARRLGMEAHAHDLNPVAVMINKAMIEIPPLFANLPPVNPEARNSALGASWPDSTGLASDVRWYGQWLKEEACKKIGHLYPKAKLPDGRSATVSAWIWARTVKCPNPVCGRETPLSSSFVLSRKKGSEAWIEPVADGDQVAYVVREGVCPSARVTNKKGRGASFRCSCCGATLEKNYIRGEFAGGRSGDALMAIIAEGDNGRVFLSPREEDRLIAESATPEWEPDEEMNTDCADLISGRGYGVDHWRQLFSRRQLTALTTLSDLVPEAMKKAEADAAAAGMPDDGLSLASGGRGARAYGEAIGVYLAFAVDRQANYASAFNIWADGFIAQTFSRQALPMVWNHAEANVFGGTSGCFDNMLDYIVRNINSFFGSVPGRVEKRDAREAHELKNAVVSSDPPYYDNIGYADISDFFYIWMRNSLKTAFKGIFKTMLTPKGGELVAKSHKFGGDREKTKEYFEAGIKEAFSRMREAARDDVPATIYYAFKQSETEGADQTASTGWETMLSALISAGFIVVGTWPTRTERTGRMLANNANALSSSIVLVCRKRPEDAPATTRRAFLAELKKTLPGALRELREGNIAPVDMAQAAIGPGMGVYSKYVKVLEADGKALGVRDALRAINAELDACLADQDGGLDEASRFCVDLYSQKAFNTIKYGDADVLARARNASIAKLDDMGVLLAEKGYVRLLTRDELPDKLPKNARNCPWALAQFLVKFLDEGGIGKCAPLVAAFPAEADRARDLAYRLYNIAERKKWAEEAFAYNSLITSWREISEEAARTRSAKMESGKLFADD